MGAIDLKVIAPLVEPLLMQAFEQVVYPAIQAEAAKISSPDVKVFVDALLPALKVAIETEIANLAK